MDRKPTCIAFQKIMHDSHFRPDAPYVIKCLEIFYLIQNKAQYRQYRRNMLQVEIADFSGETENL